MALVLLLGAGCSGGSGSMSGDSLGGDTGPGDSISGDAAGGDTLGGDTLSPGDMAAPAPTVVAVLPADNAMDVARNTLIRVTFSTAMDTTATEAAFRLEDATSTEIAGTFLWSSGDTVLTFTPGTSLDADTSFMVLVDATAMDTSSQALAAAFMSGFMTGATTSANVWDVMLWDTGVWQ